MEEGKPKNTEDLNEDPQEKLIKEIKSLKKAVNRQTSYLTFGKTIQRSFVTGVFTAIGATIGFTLFLIIVSRLLASAAGIPFVNEILRETNLDKIIEYQLNLIERSNQPSVTPSGIIVTTTTTVTPSATPTE